MQEKVRSIVKIAKSSYPSIIREAYEGSDPKNIDYSLKHTEFILPVNDGYVIMEDTNIIKYRAFSFYAFSIPELNEARKKAFLMKTDPKFFVRQNMSCFNYGWMIPDTKKDRPSPGYKIYIAGGGYPGCPKVKLAVYGPDEDSVRKENPWITTLYEASDAEIHEYLDGYKVCRRRFYKKLKKYLSIHGLKEIETSVYSTNFQYVE